THSTRSRSLAGVGFDRSVRNRRHQSERLKQIMQLPARPVDPRSNCYNLPRTPSSPQRTKPEDLRPLAASHPCARVGLLGGRWPSLTRRKPREVNTEALCTWCDLKTPLSLSVICPRPAASS